MDIQEPVEIRRPRIVTILSLFYSVLFGIIACIYLFLLEFHPAGFAWIVVSLIWFVGFLWIRKTPLVRLTHIGLIFPIPFYTRTVKWEGIQRFYTFKKKIDFVRTNGKKVTIPLPTDKNTDIAAILSILEEHIPMNEDRPAYIRSRRKKTVIITLVVLILLGGFGWGGVALLNRPQLRIQASATRSTDGILKYQLLKRKTNTLLDVGERHIQTMYIMPKNISPDDPNEVYLGSYYVTLADEFVIGLSQYGHPSIDDITGFGLWLNRLDVSTFSWEWYDRITETTFRKRQGCGEINVEYTLQDGYWAISKMTFVGEHILRADYMWNLNFQEDWHAVILDGSYMTWEMVE